MMRMLLIVQIYQIFSIFILSLSLIRIIFMDGWHLTMIVSELLELRIPKQKISYIRMKLGKGKVSQTARARTGVLDDRDMLFIFTALSIN